MLVSTIASHPPPPPHTATYLTFTQGFILGQLSVLLLVIGFVRYIVFENPAKSSPKKTPSVQAQRRSHQSDHRRSSKKSRRLSLHERPSESEIFSKIPYDLSNHPPESTDWLNVLLAQAIVTYRGLVRSLDEDDPSLPKGNKTKQMVEEALNFARGEVPGMISIDYITVTEVDFGSEYPVCTNARVRPADETGRMRVEIDVDYSDHVTLAIETKVVVNFPTTRFAVLPIALGLTLNQLSATVMAEIPPTAIPLPLQADPSSPSPAILLSLDPDFTLSTTTTSLLGSRAKLQDIPKIEQLISGRLRAWIVDNLVWPRVRVLKLPGLGNKGSVEDAADGEGEYVWIEDVSPKEKGSIDNMKDARPPKDPIGEADEDDGPNGNFTNRDEHPVNPAPGSAPSLKLQPNSHPGEQSGSSKTRAPRRSSSDFNLSTPAWKRRRPSIKLDPPGSDGQLNQRIPGGLPLSSRSIASFVDLRHSSSNNDPSFPISKDTMNHGDMRSQQYQRSDRFKFDRVNRSAEDQARWARTGGMSGVPMALYGSQFPNLGFGIRERIQSADGRKPTSADHFNKNHLNLQK